MADDIEKWLAEHHPWEWLGPTRRLQEDVYGTDFTALTGDALADYVTWNTYALERELHEFMDEINWKTWAKNRGEIPNRPAAVEELVDVAHFLANLANALGVTDAEWQAAYRKKQIKNAARQRVPDGYGRDLKCPGCFRGLDSPGGVVRTGTSDCQTIACSACDTPVAESVYAVLVDLIGEAADE